MAPLSLLSYSCRCCSRHLCRRPESSVRSVMCGMLACQSHQWRPTRWALSRRRSLTAATCFIKPETLSASVPVRQFRVCGRHSAGLGFQVDAVHVGLALARQRDQVDLAVPHATNLAYQQRVLADGGHPARRCPCTRPMSPWMHGLWGRFPCWSATPACHVRGDGLRQWCAAEQLR